MSKKDKKDGTDLQSMAFAKLKQCAPKGDANGMYEVELSRTNILSRIRYVLTTGIAAFDDIVGGMPFGRIVEVYGTEHCGKTALAIRCAVRAREGFVYELVKQKDGTVIHRALEPDEYEMAVLYIDNECSLDDDDKIVVDGKVLDVIVSRCDTVSMLFKQAEIMIGTAELKAADPKNKKLQFVVIVVDTIASTTSKQELDQEWGKEDYNRQPKQISQGFRKLVRRVNKSNCCMICTNQTRDNMKAQEQKKGMPQRGGGAGQMASDHNTFGGKALRFYASHRVFMYAMTTRYKVHPGNRFPDGILVGFQSVKNRLRMPLREGRMSLMFSEQDGGFNDLYSLLETLINYKCIEVETKEKGIDFKVKFKTHGIDVTTFSEDEIKPSLAELDDADDQPVKRKGAKKEPGFKYRSDWPAFYAAHAADIDKLWAVAVTEAFNAAPVQVPEEGDGTEEIETADD